MGLFALALRFLSWPAAALLAAAALLFNVAVMPRLGRGVYRDAGRRHDPGIVAYPAVVLAVILLFRHDLEVAAAIWGMMALGDPLASVVGKLIGGPALPWNRRKTWSGSIAYAAFGAAAGSLLFAFVGRIPFGSAVSSFALFAVLGAFLESIETGFDDNLTPGLGVAFAYATLHLGVFAREGFSLSGVRSRFASRRSCGQRGDRRPRDRDSRGLPVGRNRRRARGSRRPSLRGLGSLRGPLGVLSLRDRRLEARVFAQGEARHRPGEPGPPRRAPCRGERRRRGLARFRGRRPLGGLADPGARAGRLVCRGSRRHVRHGARHAVRRPPLPALEGEEGRAGHEGSDFSGRRRRRPSRRASDRRDGRSGRALPGVGSCGSCSSGASSDRSRKAS